jgi:hypothetical protein
MAPLIVSIGTTEETCITALTLRILVSKLRNEKRTASLGNQV